MPLRRGEVLRVTSADLPEGTRAVLEIHEETFYGNEWDEVASGPVSATRSARLRAPRSAWYRLRTDIPDETPRTWSQCATVLAR